MNYRNSEIKVDQIVSYFNEEKINLAPAFQRGHVWRLFTRKKLIENMVQGKPIPAIFLYKDAAGSRYSYNILDGKQRLESLILFIGSNHEDLRIQSWKKYFVGSKPASDVHFQIDLPGGKVAFEDLDEQVVRDFREYAIPTIEITLNDASALDEIINLFVDINQQGAKVNRFDIVKAMQKNSPLVRDVFGLIAESQKRGQDIFYKTKTNEFTSVLKRLQIVEALPDGNSKVDRMWERLLEITLFCRSNKHRKPVEVLKSFIGVSANPSPRITAEEKKRLRTAFRFLKDVYQTSTLADTRLAKDQTHFYIMITSLLGTDLLGRYDHSILVAKMLRFAELLELGPILPQHSEAKLASAVKKYKELAARQTTDVARREERQKQFLAAIDLIGEKVAVDEI